MAEIFSGAFMMQGFLQSGWRSKVRGAVDQGSAAHETPVMLAQSLIKLPKDIKTWIDLNALS
jgi:hypothetical protein